jgi:hypothetical protein
MGSKPAPMPAPVITMPANTADNLFVQNNPQRSFQDLAAAAKRLDAGIKGFQEARKLEGLDSASMAERSAARNLQESAAYLASVQPASRQERGFMPVFMDQQERPTFTKPSGTGTAAPKNFAADAAKQRFDVMQKAFDVAKAQKAKGTQDPSFVDPEKFDPEWAKVKDETFALKNLGEFKEEKA